MKTIATNKQANFNYHILETYTAGIVLTGPEVKSVKQGKIYLKGSYISIDNEEIFLVNANIPPYPPAASFQKNYDPNQKRKLLLHKKEIKHLIGKLKEKGHTIIPTKVLNKNGLIKIEIAVAKGKKKYDKRKDIKKRDYNRKKQRLLKTSVR